ncbi:MAG: 50S ribosomal protein L5 [Promethearchaeota archaeon]
MVERDFLKEWEEKPMRQPCISKVVVNFGVGTAGPKLETAKTLCQRLIDQKPLETRAKKTERGWGITKNQPIGLKVTLRGEKAIEFLKQVLWAKEDVIYRKNFDEYGNLSLGIKEHLDLPNIRYDPRIGTHGFDISVILERPGYRVKRRRNQRRKIPGKHLLTREEGIAFFQSQFSVKVLDEPPIEPEW